MLEWFTPDKIAAILNIIVIDLVLSGDNAVVIGMAASRLSGRDRRQAVLWGVVGAIGLRVLFTAMAAILLRIPLVQLIGGLMLVWIAFKLVRPEGHGEGEVKAASTKVDAIRTIVLADVVMSLDNILAVGAAAEGHIELLLFGLALSMPLITVGSGFVAWSLDKLPWLVYVGGGVLAKVAGEMIGHDPYTHTIVSTLAGTALERRVTVPLLGDLTLLELLLEVVVVIGVLAAGFIARRMVKGEKTTREQAHDYAEGAREVQEEVAQVLHRWEPEAPSTDTGNRPRPTEKDASRGE